MNNLLDTERIIYFFCKFTRFEPAWNQVVHKKLLSTENV